MDKKEVYNRVKIAIIIIIVVAIGMFAVNQTFAWYYKVEFLGNPCQLCTRLNNVICKPAIDPNNFTGEFIMPKPIRI